MVMQNDLFFRNGSDIGTKTFLPYVPSFSDTEFRGWQPFDPVPEERYRELGLTPVSIEDQRAAWERRNKRLGLTGPPPERRFRGSEKTSAPTKNVSDLTEGELAIFRSRGIDPNSLSPEELYRVTDRTARNPLSGAAAMPSLAGGASPFFDLELFEGSTEGDRLIFNSFLPTNANPFQANQFQGLFQPTFGSYLGAVGSQIKQGNAPDMSFSDFLQSDQFNPTRALLRLPGAGASRGPTLFRF